MRKRRKFYSQVAPSECQIIGEPGVC